MTTPHDTELTRSWRTPRRSTSGNECVEIAQTRESCLIRDSKQPDGTRLAIGAQAWTAFLRQVKKPMPVS